jgi:cysteine desulfurase
VVTRKEFAHGGGIDLLAAGFDGGDGGKVGRDAVGGEGLDVHGEEAEHGDVEDALAIGTVHGHGNAHDLALAGADDVNGFLDAAALGDDVLDDEDFFAGVDLEAAAEDEAALLLFGKDETATELPRDLLAEDKAAHGGRDDGDGVEGPHLVGECGAETFDSGHVLEGNGTLEEMAAVKAAAQDEMSFLISSGLAEYLHYVRLSHGAMLGGKRDGYQTGMSKRREKLPAPAGRLGFLDGRRCRMVERLNPVRTVYFDYNATTPLDPGVREAMLPFLEGIFGNPSSVHHVGRRARVLLDEARERAARVLASKPSEVVFTSGGTESNNLAVFGAARLRKPKGRHLITSVIEHHAVLHCFDYLERNEGFEVTRLPVSAEGVVSPDDLSRAMRPDTVLVSIMAANNEIGTIEPVAALGLICRERGVLFHTDAVQWFGKEPFEEIGQFNADLVSVCAHKLHGPKGAGLLYVRSPLLPDPILFGGGHENERRAGTENVAGIIGLVEALERFVKTPVFARERLLPLTRRLEEIVQGLPGVMLVCAREQRLCNTVAFLVEGSDSITLLAGLDIEGICASSGSACSAGSIGPSHVITGLGVKPELANSLVRFSLGRESTAEEVAYVREAMPGVIRRTQAGQ